MDSRPCGPTGWLALLLIKVGDVETNPCSITTHKQVWICNICHRKIYDRKQISIRYNRIEHWMHLRCACIHLAQYTYTWTCYLYKELITLSKPLPTTPTPPQPKHRHPLFLPDWSKPNLLIHLPPAPSQTHTHFTHSTTFSYPMHYTYTMLSAPDTIPEPRVPPISWFTQVMW